MNIKEKLLNNIPDYSYFYSLKEFDDSSKALAVKHPDLVHIENIGKSREGRDLLCLRIGNGPKNALFMGCPHPNEPIGSMFLEYFSHQLAEDDEVRNSFPYTFYIIKVWDVDGYVRNEGWLKGPFTVTHYTRHMYRPAGYEQVDWTFPIDYKKYHFHESIPETLAVKNLIDKIEPEFIYSLHNSGFGGVYWYLTKDIPEIYPALHRIPAKNGLPLSLGEAESPSAKVYDDAIFQNLGLCNMYDFQEKIQGDDFEPSYRCGDTSAGYSFSRYGSITLLAELPYFYDSRVEDMTSLDVSRRDCVISKKEDGIKMTAELLEILNDSKPYMGDNPYVRTVENFNRLPSSAAAAQGPSLDTPEYTRNVTVAEHLDLMYVSKFYKLTSYGMLVQAHEFAIKKLKESTGDNEEALRVLTGNLKRAEDAFGRLAAFLEDKLNYSVVPIRNMISVQLESGLIVLDAVAHKPSSEVTNEKVYS